MTLWWMLYLHYDGCCFSFKCTSETILFSSQRNVWLGALIHTVPPSLSGVWTSWLLNYNHTNVLQSLSWQFQLDKNHSTIRISSPFPAASVMWVKGRRSTCCIFSFVNLSATVVTSFPVSTKALTSLPLSWGYPMQLMRQEIPELTNLLATHTRVYWWAHPGQSCCIHFPCCLAFGSGCH